MTISSSPFATKSVHRLINNDVTLLEKCQLAAPFGGDALRDTVEAHMLGKGHQKLRSELYAEADWESIAREHVLVMEAMAIIHRSLGESF